LAVAFKISVKEAFEAFMNGCDQVNKSAHLLAKYCDDSIGSYVRNVKNSLTAEEVEGRMDSVMTLFRDGVTNLDCGLEWRCSGVRDARFISAKDIFEAHYKNDLAKRLLSAHTIRGTDEPLTEHSSYRGNELEKLMLQKLRTECGGGFTSKLEGMYKDMDLSCGLNKEFTEKRKQQQQQQGGGDGTEFEAMVLTSGIWPTYTQWPKNVRMRFMPMGYLSSQQLLGHHYGSDAPLSDIITAAELHAVLRQQTLRTDTHVDAVTGHVDTTTSPIRIVLSIVLQRGPNKSQTAGGAVVRYNMRSTGSRVT
ncbi:Cullin-4A, partial [Perkinsus olseni]